MAGGNFLGRVIGYLVNEVVVEGLANKYYCLLVPLTLPVIIVAVYLHWLSMKLFKHA